MRPPGRWAFVHGWAQSPQAWAFVRPAFPDARWIALPGHGGAPDAEPGDWTARLLDALPAEPVFAVGWSLGGMVLLDAALRAPSRFHGIVLLNAAARFVEDDDWPGAPRTAVGSMRAAIGAPRALERFLLLALHGEPRDRLRAIARAAIDRRHPPTPAGLRAGLELLATLDLRPLLQRLSVPSLWIAGARDRVLPAAAVEASAARAAGATLERWQDAGHAPLWTHPMRLIARLERWIARCS